jgi:hypothetical protein
MDAPNEVRIAILLSWSALALDTAINVYTPIQISTEIDDPLFRSVLALAILATVAIAAAFIFFAARRRNWARVSLLVWTFGSWGLWFFWPPVFADYSWWEWLSFAVILLLELVALVLLFSGKGGRWYSSKAPE